MDDMQDQRIPFTTILHNVTSLENRRLAELPRPDGLPDDVRLRRGDVPAEADPAEHPRDLPATVLRTINEQPPVLHLRSGLVSAASSNCSSDRKSTRLNSSHV